MKRDPNAYTIPVYRLQLVQEGTVETAAVTGPADLALHLRDIAAADREHMVAVFLDTRNRPIGRQVVSVGTLNATLVDARGVFRAALLNGAASGVAIGHNHPSGDLSPSRDDDDVTRRIARAGELLGVKLIDHVILAPDGRHFSSKDQRPEFLEGGPWP